jgi:hypothetical protein
MNTLRKIALFFIGLALFISLPLNTLVWTTRQTILERQVVLGWLKQGKVYDNIADTAAKIAEDTLKNKENNPDQGMQNGNQDGGGSMPDAATLVKAAKVALPPNVLQQNVEAIINGAYDWLDGKTETVVVNLDLTDEKKAFIDALGNEAISRAASLPACTQQQTSDFDPLSSNCIPSGVNVAAQANKIKEELASSKDFLPDTNITSEDLKVGDEGNKQLISDAFSPAKKVYGYGRDLAYVATAILAIDAVLIFFLGKTRRSGLKVNAWIFGLAGGWALLIGALLKALNSSIVNNALSRTGDASIGNSLVGPLATQILSSLSKWNLVIGGAYASVAIICITSVKLMKKGSGPTAEEKPKPSAPVATSQASKPDKTVPEAPKPKKPNLVQ